MPRFPLLSRTRGLRQLDWETVADTSREFPRGARRFLGAGIGVKTPGRVSDMLLSKRVVALLATVICCTENGHAQENRGTPEQRAACTPDAFRLCSSYIPDSGQVETCLRQRKSDLTDACRSVFDQGSHAASRRGRNDDRATPGAQ